MIHLRRDGSDQDRARIAAVNDIFSQHAVNLLHPVPLSERRAGRPPEGRAARLHSLAAAALCLVEAEHRATSVQACSVAVDVPEWSAAPSAVHDSPLFRRRGRDLTARPAAGRAFPRISAGGRQ